MKLLSIRQPWAYLILNKTNYTVTEHFGDGTTRSHILFDKKIVENRTRKTNYRGPLLIHASKKVEIPNSITVEQVVGGRLYSTLHNNDLCVHEDDVRGGGIVGIAHLADCRKSAVGSPWWEGDSVYGYVLYFATSLPFSPLKGGLGIRDVARVDLLPETQEAIDAWMKQYNFEEGAVL